MVSFDQIATIAILSHYFKGVYAVLLEGSSKEDFNFFISMHFPKSLHRFFEGNGIVAHIEIQWKLTFYIVFLFEFFIKLQVNRLQSAHLLGLQPSFNVVFAYILELRRISIFNYFHCFLHDKVVFQIIIRIRNFAAIYNKKRAIFLSTHVLENFVRLGVRTYNGGTSTLNNSRFFPRNFLYGGSQILRVV